MKKQLKKFCSVTSLLRSYTGKHLCWVFMYCTENSTTLQHHGISGSILELRLDAPLHKPGYWVTSLEQLERRIKEPGDSVMLGDLMPDTEETCRELPSATPNALALPAGTLEAFRFCASVVLSACETREHLHQVLIIPQEGKVITTDGHRMHVATIPRFDYGQCAIKRSDFCAILKLVGSKEPDTMHIDGDYLVTCNDDLRLRTVLTIGEDFPEYTRVVPNTKHYDVRVEFDARKWLKLVPKKGSVKLAVNGAVTLTTELGTVVDLPALSNSGEVIIGVNSPYVAEALVKDEMTLHLRGSLDPLVFEGADRMAVIMPLRI